MKCADASQKDMENIKVAHIGLFLHLHIHWTPDSNFLVVINNSTHNDDHPSCCNDQVLYNVPEGSYASNPDDASRIKDTILQNRSRVISYEASELPTPKTSI